MTSCNRRRFLQLSGLATAVAAARPVAAVAGADAAPAGTVSIDNDRTVRLSGDGLGLSPSQYAGLLERLVEEKGFSPDSYSLGGVVEELEERCARLLGKERAIFMPTGTLANHMAVRVLAGGSSRVIV